MTYKNTDPMAELKARPVIDISAAVEKLFDGAMELLEGTRRLMEEHPETVHKQWDYTEAIRPNKPFGDWTVEETETYEKALEEVQQLHPNTVIGSGGDDTWFDYHPCDLEAVISIIKLSLRVIGTDEWAGPPKPEETQPLIKPLLTEWLKEDAVINDPASQVGDIVPYLYNWLHTYDIDTTDCGSLDPEDFAETQKLMAED